MVQRTTSKKSKFQIVGVSCRQWVSLHVKLGDDDDNDVGEHDDDEAENDQDEEEGKMEHDEEAQVEKEKEVPEMTRKQLPMRHTLLLDESRSETMTKKGDNNETHKEKGRKERNY